MYYDEAGLISKFLCLLEVYSIEGIAETPTCRVCYLQAGKKSKVRWNFAILTKCYASALDKCNLICFFVQTGDT